MDEKEGRVSVTRKVMSLQDVIPSADAQVGSAGCSTASIGSRTLLGLKEFAPQGLLAWNDVCNCWRHLNGFDFVQAKFI